MRMGSKLLTVFGGGETPWPQYSNLAALYLMSEGAGTTLLDSGPHKLHGTFGATTAAPTWAAEGLSFDGGDNVSLPGGGALDISGTNATIAIVFNVSSSQCILLGAYGANSKGYGISLNGDGSGSGTIVFYTDGGVWDKPKIENWTGSWNCCIGALTAGTWTWQLNGNAYGSPVTGASITADPTTKRIGIHSNVITFPTTGKIGMLGIWPVALTATEQATVYRKIQQLMIPRGVTLPDPT